MQIHCTALAATALLVVAVPSLAQLAPAAPQTGEAVFNIFLHGTQVGREQGAVARDSSGWILTSSGRTGAPFDFAVAHFEMKYTVDWQPLELKLEATLKGVPIALATSFGMTTAINEVTQAGTTHTKEDQISARTLVLPNNVFGSYEALAARLSTATVGAELPIYVIPDTEIKVRVVGITPQTLTGPSGSIATNRYDLTFQNAGGAVTAILVADARLRLVRFELPTAGVLVVRDDAASVAMRPETARNPTDAGVSIQANGFQLAATLTTPPGVAGRLRYPAVLLVGKSSPADRDETVDGVPVLAELARALADSGHVVLRYDRRGSGQSGGRTDSVTLSDYADDAVAAAKWLAHRDDVDGRRLVVCGHGDGAAVALIAASRDKSIDGVVTIGAAGSPGAEVLLREQQRILDGMKLSDADREARIALQKKIQAAVISGSGWTGVPDAMHRQADTAWFKSLLTYNPALVLPKVRQPLLILQGDRDAQMPSDEAERLAEVARARKKIAPPEVVHLADVNQALLASNQRTVSDKVATAIADWIKKTF